MAAKQVKHAKVQAAARCWQQVMLRKAWGTWQDRAAGWADKRAKVALAAGRWHNAALSQAFQEWREGVAYAQETKEKLLAAAGWILDCAFLGQRAAHWAPKRANKLPFVFASLCSSSAVGTAAQCCVGHEHTVV